MKLIYLTAKQYPGGGTADHHYIKALAYALHRELGEQFLFIACNTAQKALPGLPVRSVAVPSFIKRTVVFFFWLPWFWYAQPQQRADVFFTNDFNLVLVLSFWKKLLWLPYKVVSDWHLMTTPGKDRRVIAASDLCITTSKALEEGLHTLVPSAHTKTLYGGVDLSAYPLVRPHNLREALQLPQGAFLAGYVGLFTTMGMEKGLRTMLRALTLLPQEVCMVFVGGKDYEIKQYRAYAREEGMEERSIFVPLQPFSRVVEYEQAVDVLVIPYPDQPHFRRYGFPMKVYEYMASGTPVVYTTLPLAQEMLGDCAFGVAPDDARALADTLLAIKADGAEATRRAQHARNKVAGYTWAAKAQALIQTINDLHA